MRRTDPAHYYERREYFEQVPEELVEEQFELLAKGGDVRLERDSIQRPLLTWFGLVRPKPKRMGNRP